MPLLTDVRTSLPNTAAANYTFPLESGNDNFSSLTLSQGISYTLFENALKCKHYNPNSFDPDFQPDISLFIIHFNMRSLQGNFEKLRDIPLLIKSSSDIISISETKIQNKTYTDCGKNEPLSNIALDVYQFYHVPSPTNAGGVVMYIF